MDTSSLDLDDSSVSLGNGILTPTTGRHNPRSQNLWKVGGKSEPAERPLRVLCEDRITGCTQLRKPRANFSVSRFAQAQAGISDRYACISHQPAPLRALHRASAKHGAEFLFGERDHPLEVRR